MLNYIYITQYLLHIDKNHISKFQILPIKQMDKKRKFKNPEKVFFWGMCMMKKFLMIKLTS